MAFRWFSLGNRDRAKDLVVQLQLQQQQQRQRQKEEEEEEEALIHYCCVATRSPNKLDIGIETVVDYFPSHRNRSSSMSRRSKSWSGGGGGGRRQTQKEHSDRDRDREQMRGLALACLRALPPHHREFSFTAGLRTLACVLDGPWLFCAIADEALRRSDALAFLHAVRHEFSQQQQKSSSSAGSSSALLTADEPGSDNLYRHYRGFKPVLKRLAAPYVGLTQLQKNHIALEREAQAQAQAQADASIEAHEASLSEPHPNHEAPPIPVAGGSNGAGAAFHAYAAYYDPSPSTVDRTVSPTRLPFTPLINRQNVEHGGKQKRWKPSSRGVDVVVGSGEDIARNGGARHAPAPPEANGALQWLRRINWKWLLVIDVAVCVVLFCIWLGVCRGLQCTMA